MAGWVGGSDVRRSTHGTLRARLRANSVSYVGKDKGGINVGNLNPKCQGVVLRTQGDRRQKKSFPIPDGMVVAAMLRLGVGVKDAQV